MDEQRDFRITTTGHGGCISRDLDSLLQLQLTRATIHLEEGLHHGDDLTMQHFCQRGLVSLEQPSYESPEPRLKLALMRRV